MLCNPLSTSIALAPNIGYSVAYNVWYLFGYKIADCTGMTGCVMCSSSSACTECDAGYELNGSNNCEGEYSTSDIVFVYQL